MNARPGTQRPRGFMLMETLVASLILAVALVVLLGSIKRDLEIGMYVREKTTAMFLAQTVMAEVENKALWQNEADTLRKYGSFDPPNADYEYDIDIDTQEEVSEHRIIVSVTWTHRGKEKTHTIHTVIPMDRAEEFFK